MPSLAEFGVAQVVDVDVDLTESVLVPEDMWGVLYVEIDAEGWYGLTVWDATSVADDLRQRLGWVVNDQGGGGGEHYYPADALGGGYSESYNGGGGGGGGGGDGIYPGNPHMFNQQDPYGMFGSVPGPNHAQYSQPQQPQQQQQYGPDSHLNYPGVGMMDPGNDKNIKKQRQQKQ